MNIIKQFYDRINLKSDLSQLSKLICKKYNLGQYVSEKPILVGYEDFNFILKTDIGKFCVKVFNKDRTDEDVKKYIDRIKLANSLNINTPKVYQCDNSILCKIIFDDTKFRLCVFQYIEGKSFYDLNQTPTQTEIKNIVEQMAHIHNTKLELGFIYDKWTITNFIKEYEEKGKYLDNKYNNTFKALIDKFGSIKFEELPTSFVHGDIISSNIIKDNNNKLWIIDFAVSNCLPRIVDLAVTACNLCFNTDSIDKTIQSTKMILDQYQKYNRLTNYELECFPLFYDLANAMCVLQISYLKFLGEISKEDKFWLNESEKGLSFSTKSFWERIIQ